MIWLFFIPLQLYLVFNGFRQQEREGSWSWSLFAFVLGFLAFESLILTLPIRLALHGNRYFVPVYTTALIIAALNFVWFLAVCRRWKLKPPDRQP
jgi:hypothetical protein